MDRYAYSYIAIRLARGERLLKKERMEMKKIIKVLTIESDGLKYIVNEHGIMCHPNGTPITSIDIPLLKLGEQKIEVECVE